MIPAVFARAVAARLGPVLARLEPRHWVALIGSAALHLGVFLGLSQAPPPLPPPLTFEVKLEPPPGVKQPRPRHVEAKPKASKAKVKKRLAKKKPVKPLPREPHTLEAEWKSETRPAKDTPAVTLPDAHALGINVASAVGRVAPAKLASSANTRSSKAVAAAAANSSAASALSEPGGKAGAGNGAASGGDPGIALAAAHGLGKTQALSANSGAGAQGSDALAGSAAASGNLAAAALSASAAAGGSLDRAAGGGGQSAQAGDSSSHPPGSAIDASGEPGGVRLTMAGILSSLAALPSGSGSLPSGQLGGQISGQAGLSAATAGQGGQANLDTAASGGQPAVAAATGPTRAGAAGSETSAANARGAAASGGSGAGNLASAVAGSALVSSKPGRGQGGAKAHDKPAGDAQAGAVAPASASKTTLVKAGSGDSAGRAPAAHKRTPGGGEATARSAVATAARTDPANGAGKLVQAATAGSQAGANAGANAGTNASAGAVDSGTSSGNLRGLSGAGAASGAGRLAAASSLGGALPGQASNALGMASGAAVHAALAPGEPGSTPGLAVAMATVPAILEMRGAGARSAFRAQAGEGGGGAARAATATLDQTTGGQGAPLQGRADAAPALSAASRQASVGGGGNNPAGTGTLQGVSVAAARQIRADSQVQPLDVLAPSTYCPLPGHVQPDNRPRDTAQDITEKPAYASDNPSFSFPLRAWAYGHQGRAIVRVQVLEDGTPGQMWLKQSSGSGILDVDVREQLAKYRFKPARKNGQPVTAWIDVPVDYRLNAEK